MPISGISFSCGLYIKNFDFIFRSPGFRRIMPELLTAEKAGAVISSATKLFFDFCPGKIIGVTGTKGKGTTATLIYQILKADQKKVFLAGNIGVPMLSLLSQLTKDSWLVLELSSFQLQDLTKSPKIGVVLFVSSEHLDYHRNKAEYIRAKTNLVAHQTGTDFAVFNAEDSTSRSFAKLTPAKVFYYSRKKKVNGSYVAGKQLYLLDKKVGNVDNLQIPGIHNWDNIAAAVMAGHLAGADLKSIKKAVFSFQGLEHRLELAGQYQGVTYYNDSFATTPETTSRHQRKSQRSEFLIRE